VPRHRVRIEVGAGNNHSKLTWLAPSERHTGVPDTTNGIVEPGRDSVATADRRGNGGHIKSHEVISHSHVNQSMSQPLACPKRTIPLQIKLALASGS
jgi:hypothetical protein